MKCTPAVKAEAASPPVHFKTLLVPTDFSDCSLVALDYALALAIQFHAKIVLLHIVEPLAILPVLDEIGDRQVRAGRERLAALCRKRIGNRVPFEVLVRMGRAHSEIPDTAKALDADLIVIATHGNTGLREALLGSTAQRVVTQAHCPVLTVRPPPEEGG
jgi:nucleotide-binding universal stress UspA family protein